MIQYLESCHLISERLLHLFVHLVLHYELDRPHIAIWYGIAFAHLAKGTGTHDRAHGVKVAEFARINANEVLFPHNKLIFRTYEMNIFRLIFCVGRICLY